MKRAISRWTRGMATALLACLPAAGQGAGLLPNGDFEAGFLIGWIASEERDGIADLVTAGTCFSTDDTTRITLFDNHAAILRSGPSGRRSSVGILTSEPFAAGDGVVFAALTGTREGKRIDHPVTFEVRILDADGGILASHDFQTSVVRLSAACPGEPRDGRFYVHYVDTRPFLGDFIRIQFRQNTNTGGYQPFTLIDQVIRFDRGEAPLFASKPLAVAGTSETRRGALRLDASASLDPDEGPLALTYRWQIDGEEQYRDGEYPCVADLADGEYRATVYANDGFHAVSDTLHFVVEGNGDGLGTVASSDAQEDGTEGDGNNGDGNDSDSGTGPRVTIAGCDNRVVAVGATGDAAGGDSAGSPVDGGGDDGTGSGGSDGDDGNTAPTVDLDDDDSTDGGNNFRATVTAIDTGVAVADGDLLVDDADGDSIERAVIILENPSPQGIIDVVDTLSVDEGALPAAITVDSIDADSIVLTGSASFVAYQTALAAIRFSTSSLEDKTERVIRITVNDGSSSSSPAFATLAIGDG